MAYLENSFTSPQKKNAKNDFHCNDTLVLGKNRAAALSTVNEEDVADVKKTDGNEEEEKKVIPVWFRLWMDFRCV